MIYREREKKEGPRQRSVYRRLMESLLLWIPSGDTRVTFHLVAWVFGEKMQPVSLCCEQEKTCAYQRISVSTYRRCAYIVQRPMGCGLIEVVRSPSLQDGTREGSPIRKEHARLSQSHHLREVQTVCRCMGMSVLQQAFFGDGLMDVNVFNMLLPGVCSGLVRCTSYALSRGIEEQSP
jgi:hypothetical protein